jgi:pimeloyl-ACP methyl ester carboxylesterase
MKTGALIVALVLLAIALITGAAYEQAERALDREQLPQIGRSIDIGCRALNIDCAGSGSPVVIFACGAPRPGYSWVFIQREVAKFTSACWYDRAGFGWSDLGPSPRTSVASARDLHTLLQRAAIPPPYLLVPETLSALDARAYTRVFPNEVAGLVMVDAVHPELFTRLPQIRGKAAPVHKYIADPENIVWRFANEIGLLQFMSANRRTPGPPPPEWTPQEWTAIWRLTNEPRARVALLQEFSAMDESIAQARAISDLGDRPLRVISVATPGQQHQEQDIAMELQADLVHLSTRGKQVIVDLQRDCLLLYQAPHAVIDSIHEVADSAPATLNGPYMV